MKHKVSELEGALLDAAVAKALGHRDLQLKSGEWRSRTEDGEMSPVAAFSENWAAGGPIIERERITIVHFSGPPWGAFIWPGSEIWIDTDVDEAHGVGPTSLIAAMRAFVASKLGEEVEL